MDNKSKDKKNIDLLFEAIKLLNKAVSLLAYSFDSKEITAIIKKVSSIHEVRNKKDS